jgi:hypothetical protein
MKINHCRSISLVCAAFVCALPLSAQQATPGLKATPKTVAWGYYDAKAAPVMHVKWRFRRPSHRWPLPTKNGR